MLQASSQESWTPPSTNSAADVIEMISPADLVSVVQLTRAKQAYQEL